MVMRRHNDNVFLGSFYNSGCYSIISLAILLLCLDTEPIFKTLRVTTIISGDTVSVATHQLLVAPVFHIDLLRFNPLFRLVIL